MVCFSLDRIGSEVLLLFQKQGQRNADEAKSWMPIENTRRIGLFGNNDD